MTLHNQDEIVVLKTCSNIAEAITTKEQLEEAGITVTIDDMDVTGLTPLAGINVKIFSKDLEKARQLLQAS